MSKMKMTKKQTFFKYEILCLFVTSCLLAQGFIGIFPLAKIACLLNYYSLSPEGPKILDVLTS